MTDLMIDGVHVDLPEGFSVQAKRENCFFTKSGEYTYDIELPMTSKTNQKLYGFLNRWSTQKMPRLNRKAILTADNRVYLRGTEVITGWTDRSVKVQLVSGNSELNWLVTDELLLSDLDTLGEDLSGWDADLSGWEPEQRLITETYPDIPLAVPFVAGADGEKMNEWVWDDTQHRWVGAASGFYGMPFLCRYLQMVVEGLGYAMSTNELDKTLAAHIILIHSQKETKWWKLFPGMTVKDFLVAVEQTFNVTFMVDQKKKAVRVVSNLNALSSDKRVFIDKVGDEYECVTGDDDEVEELMYDSTSFELSYDLPSSDYYNQAHLSDYVKEVAMRYDAISLDYDNLFNGPYITSNLIYWCLNEEDPARYDYHFTQGDHSWPAWHLVDTLRSYVVGDGQVKLKMKMVPAETMADDRYIYMVAGDTAPKVDGELKLDDILSLTEKPKGDAGVIRMALYTGLTAVQRPRLFCPIAYTDHTMQSKHFPVDVFDKDSEPSHITGLDLRPSTMAREFFVGKGRDYTIDVEHEYHVKCYGEIPQDITSIFVIKHRTFVCRSIEYTIGPDGVKKEWTGTFYAINVSKQ